MDSTTLQNFVAYDDIFARIKLLRAIEKQFALLFWQPSFTTRHGGGGSGGGGGGGAEEKSSMRSEAEDRVGGKTEAGFLREMKKLKCGEALERKVGVVTTIGRGGKVWRTKRRRKDEKERRRNRREEEE